MKNPVPQFLSDDEWAEFEGRAGHHAWGLARRAVRDLVAVEDFSGLYESA